MSMKEIKIGSIARTTYQDVEAAVDVLLGGRHCEAVVRKDSTTERWQKWSLTAKTSGASESHGSLREGGKLPQRSEG